MKVLFLLVVLLAGCQEPTTISTVGKGAWHEEVVTLSDGTTVLCLRLGVSSGISCDWGRR